jgi:SAM-dependent methyltransferase
LQRWREPFFTAITAPALLNWGSKKSLPAKSLTPRHLKSAYQARFVLRRLLGHTRRVVSLTAPRANQKSRWSSYLSQELPYTADQFFDKHSFIDQCLTSVRPKTVLDVGCNTGHFSELAAKSGARVVAIDKDPVVVGKLWSRAHHRKADILPLVVDFAAPSPSVGWRNVQCPSFLARSKEKFDCVFLLALIHHLMYADEISLDEILKAAHSLTREHLLLEYIGPDDPSVQQLIAAKGLRPIEFNELEAALQTRFEIVDRKRIVGNNRILYLAKKKKL